MFKDVSKYPLWDIVSESNVLQLQKGSNEAQGDDALSLKKEVMIWLGNLHGPIHPPISPSLNLEHDVMEHLLCSVKYDWNDAEMRRKICKCYLEFLVAEDSWPRFLYGTRYEYDPNNIKKGLFKSMLLLKGISFKLIFTSPTLAQKVSASEHPEMHNMYRHTYLFIDKSTCLHITSIISMHFIKPQVIVYIAVQLHFVLSSLTCWHIIDGDFDAHSFYQNIINYFEALSGLVRNLLLWWDSYETII
ncbi:hypothetical protein HD554DRAFT_2026990 [Boletus coccyginus]|nr:hypothetical protein HD554DRAFT_2026990 [Boletus coccyginus]